MAEEPEKQDQSESGGDEASPGFRRAAAKVREFPQTPGVYLMKDLAGRVIYVGKATNLRSRAGSYFLKAAADERRTAELVREICDIDFIEAESEVDALLVEARLIKDVQPKYNKELKDDKTFPYLEIYVREDFPRVEFTREPSDRGTKLYGPFASAGSLRGPSRCCKRSSNSALAVSTSTMATRNGAGSGLACWPASTSVQPPAICGSRRKSTARTSIG